jgi:integrase/recombinase XerC
MTLREIQKAGGSSTESPAWVREFRRALSTEDLALTTVRAYWGDLNSFSRWYAPNALEALTAVDLISYRQHLSEERSLRPASVNRKLEALRRFCRWACQQGRLPSNVAAEVRLARPQRGVRPAGLTEAEAQGLLRAAGQSPHGLGTRNYALLQVMLQAGLRVGEVAGLHISDVELRARAGTVRVRHGKGRKEREVPLNASARRGLSAYLKARSEYRPDDPLFCSETGTAISLRSIQAMVSNLARRAKITRIPVSAHTARHTFALAFLRQNPGKLVELAALLGHESLDTTAIYTQPSTEEMAEDVERSRLNIDR